MEFTHLHVHTEYSLLDGSNKIKEYVARVKELGMASKTKTNNIWWLHPQAPVESITLVLDIR